MCRALTVDIFLLKKVSNTFERMDIAESIHEVLV